MADQKHEIISTNESSDLDKLLQLSQNNAMSINGIARSLGVIQSGLEEHAERIVALEAFRDKTEQEKRVNRSEGDRLKKAVLSRVKYLLSIDTDDGMVAEEQIEFEQRYRPGFISRCYSDARYHSKLGTPYYETLHKDFDEVLEYISAWEPEVKGGVVGYMRYLDIRREKRSKRS